MVLKCTNILAHYGRHDFVNILDNTDLIKFICRGNFNETFSGETRKVLEF